MTSAVRRWPARWPAYVFVLWSTARDQEHRILDDLAGRFRLVDLFEVTWTPDDTFSRNLTRMYGDALPPGSDKEVHSGTGPFLLVVVEDPRPRPGLRRTGKGFRILNAAVFDARLRYRGWTGGGYRVHASDSVKETERNLVLLLGKRRSDLTGPPPADVADAAPAADPVGTRGWDSVAQLWLVLEEYGGRRLEASADRRTLRLTTADGWWAEQLAGGRELGPGRRAVCVAGETVELHLVEQLPVRTRVRRRLSRR